MSVLFIGLLLIASMASFAASMPTHCRVLYGQRELPDYTFNIKRFAYGLLAISFALSQFFWSTGMALIYWTALLTLAGALVGLVLSYRPLWLQKLLPASLIMACGVIFTLH